MEKKICTDIKQSKKLIALGIDANTADMYYYDKDAFTGALSAFNGGVLIRNSNNEFPNKTTPAWSLSALLELFPKKDDPVLFLTNISPHKEGENYLQEYSTLYFGNDICYRTQAKDLIDAVVELIQELKEKELL